MDDIIWLDSALSDLDEIAAYISTDNPYAAERIVQRIVESVSALSWHPRLGRPNEDGQTRRLTIVQTPYLAIYRLSERVEILAIFHTSRKWPPSAT